MPARLLRGTLIKIRYQSWRAEKQRRVAPLGLVLKGGSWYLAGQVDGSVRTYRVARVLDCTALDDRFDRPADFDLAAYWQAATLRLEAEMHPNVAIVRLSPFGVKLLDALSQPYVKARTQLKRPRMPTAGASPRVPTGKTSWHAAPNCCGSGPRPKCWSPPISARRWRR